MKILNCAALLLVFNLSGITQCKMQEPANEFKVDEKVKERFGSEVATMLENATTLDAYVLSPMEEVNDSVKSFMGYRVKDRLDSVTVEHLDTLRRLLGKQSSYIFDDAVKMCLFLPEVGYRLTDSSMNKLDVLVSSHCKEVRFYWKDDELVEDCDHAIGSFRAIEKQIFSKQ
jgi:hypothetical protein